MTGTAKKYGRAARYAGFCSPQAARRSSLSGRRCRRPPAAYPKVLSGQLNLLLGLAPDEVYRADPVTRIAGGLLHRRFTLTRSRSTRPRAVYSLLHFLSDCSGWALPTIVPYGARTFLGARRRRDRLDDPSGPEVYSLCPPTRNVHGSVGTRLATACTGRAAVSAATALRTHSDSPAQCDMPTSAGRRSPAARALAASSA